jgi:uncharacterized membrane protein YqhA
MLKTVLLNSRHLAYIAVISTLICALVLYVLTAIAAATTIYGAVTSDSWDVYSINTVAASFLKVVDFFLLSIGLQIIAAGVYRLLIDENIELPDALSSDSFVDLKLTLVKLATIVLLLDFVEHALSAREARELMEYGIGVAVVLVAVSWGSKQLSTHSKNKDGE